MRGYITLPPRGLRLRPIGRSSGSPDGLGSAASVSDCVRTPQAAQKQTFADFASVPAADSCTAAKIPRGRRPLARTRKVHFDDSVGGELLPEFDLLADGRHELLGRSTRGSHAVVRELL